MFGAYREGNSSGMRWFRANRLLGGCLALFALGLQLVVSFAHVHPEDFIPNNDLVLNAEFRVAGHISNADLSGHVVIGAVAPSDHGSGAPHDDCPICASMYLISTAVVGESPVLSVPATFNSVSVQTIGDFEFQPVRYSSFQTRAPPAI